VHEPRRAALLVDVEDRPCLVVGGGAAGAAKAARLADAGARVTVVDPRPEPTVGDGDDRVRVERRAFRDDDVAGTWLVVTATDDPALNDRAAATAEAAGIWVNRADRPDGGPACLVASLTEGPVQVAVGTSGLSPALGVWLRDRVAEVVGPSVGRLAELLAERGRDGSGQRGHRGLPFDAALERLAAGDEDGARSLLGVPVAAAGRDGSR
jgi:siroheme synthase-like protein